MALPRLLGPLAAGMLTLAAPAATGAELVVRVQGVGGAVRGNVEARLGILRYADAQDIEDAQVRRLHRKAEGEIREALQAFGYYAPRIDGRLDGQAPDWVARYDIDPGPPTLVSQVRVDLDGAGHTFAPLTAIAERAMLRSGAPLRHAEYAALKTALARTAYEHGFLDARFRRHELRVVPEERRAEFHLELETGPRYHFGDVIIEQHILDPAFIARYVPIRPGAPFTPATLLETQFALQDLGYFASVEAVMLRDRIEDNRIPVRIDTTPRPARRYDFGVGYGTDTGARLSAGTEFRRLTDTGHTLRTDVRLSEIKNRIGGEYRVPLGRIAGESLAFSGAYTDEQIGDGESLRYDFGVALDRTPGDWQRRLYTNYLFEASSFPATGTDQVKLVLPGISLTRNETDDPIHARSGWYLFIDLHGAHEDLVSDTTFLQGRVLLRGALPLGARGRLLGRAELGATSIDAFRELPVSQRFFAGGDQSVRGYAYQSLGPRDPDGAVRGGEYLQAFSLEADWRLFGRWGAALFMDAGNASDEPAPPLSRGVGAGVRWRAPVGTVQVDLAHPLDGEERGLRPHLGIRVGL